MSNVIVKISLALNAEVIDESGNIEAIPQRSLIFVVDSIAWKESRKMIMDHINKLVKETNHNE